MVDALDTPSLNDIYMIYFYYWIHIFNIRGIKMEQLNFFKKVC